MKERNKNIFSFKHIFVFFFFFKITKKPENMTDAEAASLLYAGLTAWSALKVSGLLFVRSAHNKKVLVLGGSGGVGSIAIQLLKNWGATVTDLFFKYNLIVFSKNKILYLFYNAYLFYDLKNKN